MTYIILYIHIIIQLIAIYCNTIVDLFLQYILQLIFKVTINIYCSGPATIYCPLQLIVDMLWSLIWTSFSKTSSTQYLTFIIFFSVTINWKKVRFLQKKTSYFGNKTKSNRKLLKLMITCFLAWIRPIETLESFGTLQ